MRSRLHHVTNSVVPVLVGIAMLALLGIPTAVNAQADPISLPVYQLDVLDEYLWSSSELYLAPGQTITITNRDVDRHTFTVDEWDIDLNLPTLQEQSTTVPMDVEPGQRFQFYSSAPQDPELGLIGTIIIVPEEDVIAGSVLVRDLIQTEPDSRVRIEARDDFTFQPAIVEVAPGTILEIENTGVISHNFVVDAWNVNQTIAPSNMVLVRVPETVPPNATIEFYCSVPGHAQLGMVGVLRISGNSSQIATVVRTEGGRTENPIDMRPFVPGEGAFGDGWSRVRSGSSESILGNRELNGEVFPYSGIGAVYVGPNGARVTVVALPLHIQAIPLNQVTDSVRSVQDVLATSWSVDRVASAAWRSVSPPNGCTVSDRVSGLVPVITLAGGVTSCQLAGVGVALFVSVEGEYDGHSGVLASDRVVAMIIRGDGVASGAI